MTERFDSFAKVVAERTTRRRTLAGLGALALGSLGILGGIQETRAENRCKRCRRKCQHNNKKKGKKNPNNCSSRCRNICNNN